MKTFLVLGDLILDQYFFHAATRLCQEGPVPVLVQTEPVRESQGGAGLVAAQLGALVGENNVLSLYGSKSRKERYFADGRLMLRRDFDRLHVSDPPTFSALAGHVMGANRKSLSMLVVSDYGKGTFTEETARSIMLAARRLGIPVLVDAKHNWAWWRGAFAMFPNAWEASIGFSSWPLHTVQKLGADGCAVDGARIPPNRKRDVKDTTGAGDIFLAAFAAELGKLGMPGQEEAARVLQDCARFANAVAGQSVEHVGTYVVTEFAP